MGKLTLLFLSIYLLIGYCIYRLIPFIARMTRQDWENGKEEYSEKDDKSIDEINRTYEKEGIFLVIVCMITWLPAFAAIFLKRKRQK